MTPAQINEIYDQISKLTITLHVDPASLGPKYLQDAIATCNNYKNQVSGILSGLMRKKHEVSRDLQARQAAYQVSFDDLLANNESVRRLPNIEDRRATANVMLRTDRQAITKFEAELKDLESVEKVVRHRHKELSDTMGAIKVQRSLIRDEIDTKSFYGDERMNRGVPGASSSPLGDDDLDEETLSKLLDGVNEETRALALPVVEPPASSGENAEEGSSDEHAMRRFLGDEKSSSAEDFSDVFSRL
jgi:hypothetical protein